MKRLFLMGRSESGKTSLTQALKGEELHYHKTQYTNTAEDTIDTPGEYAESKNVGVALACFSFEADIIAIVMAADEPFSVFEANCQCFVNRPLIGIVTKIDSPYANIPMVRQWLANSGCDPIFEVNNVTKEGIPELMDTCREIRKKSALSRQLKNKAVGLMPGKSNRITIKRLMQMDVSVFFVSVNQGVINSCRFLKNGPLCGSLKIY